MFRLLLFLFKSGHKSNHAEPIQSTISVDHAQMVIISSLGEEVKSH